MEKCELDSTHQNILRSTGKKFMTQLCVLEQLTILKQMILALPEPISTTLLNQFNKVILANEARQAVLNMHLDDIRHKITHMQFNIEATTRERDYLQSQLDKLQ